MGKDCPENHVCRAAFKNQLGKHLPVRNGLVGLALPRGRVIAER